MTRGERDYSKGKIYALKCNITGEQYVGSTCKDYLSQRLVAHRRDYGKWKDGKYHFTTSFHIIERGSYDMVLLEDYPCQSKDQLHARERYWIESGECVNKVIPTRSMKEYSKQYRQAHREEIKQHERTTLKCGCGQGVSRGNLSRHLKTKKHKEWEANQHSSQNSI